MITVPAGTAASISVSIPIHLSTGQGATPENTFKSGKADLVPLYIPFNSRRTFHFAKSLVNTELKQFHAPRAERGKSSTFSFPSSPHLASPACHFLYPCLTREGLSLLPPLPGEFSVPNPALTTHWHVHFKQIRVQVSNYCLTRRCDFEAEISKALRWQCTMLASLTAASAPQPQAEDLGLFPGKAQ